jgi:hypothetical protein
VKWRIGVARSTPRPRGSPKFQSVNADALRNVTIDHKNTSRRQPLAAAITGCFFSTFTTSIYRNDIRHYSPAPYPALAAYTPAMLGFQTDPRMLIL